MRGRPAAMCTVASVKSSALKWGLGENDRNAPSDTEYHLGKNLTQYSYTGIKDFGYKKDLFRNFKMNISFLLCFII